MVKEQMTTRSPSSRKIAKMIKKIVSSMSQTQRARKRKVKKTRTM